MKLTILDSHLRSDYIDKYAVGNIFIETGSWLGDNAELVRQHGRFKIHSIEGDRERFEYCRNRFADNPEILMWNGESAETLRHILTEINSPVTFWLDSPAPSPGQQHPILDELQAIAEHSVKDHTIFIDDRRLFSSSEWGEEVTEEKALSLLQEINPNYKIDYLDGEIPNDIIVASVIANE